MTPEEEEAFRLQMKTMQAKLDSYEKEKTDKANVKLDSLRKEMASLTGEKLDSFQTWDEKSLDSSIKVLKKNKVDKDAEPTEDELVPKLDSKGNEIPWAMRVNWSNASYPAWE